MTALGFDAEQWNRIAADWEDCGPLLEHWLRDATELMLDQAGVGPGSRVLDVAAGAGGQTLMAARRTGPDGILLATDIAELLVERVRANAIAEGISHVYATVADAEELEFDPGAFDAAICRLGLMYLPDVATALRGIRVALRPGGRFSAVVFAEPEHNPLLAAIAPAAPDEPGPFSLSAPGVLVAALSDAGFTDVEAEHVDAPLRLATAADAVALLGEVEADLDDFEDPDGFHGPCRLLVAGGRRS
jgi:SAM-dependent methyltransferase